mgnify:CR=1 FL=1
MFSLFLALFSSFLCDALGESELWHSTEIIQNSKDTKDLQNRGGLIYLKNNKVPFSGTSVSKFNDGQINLFCKFEDGSLKNFERYWNNGSLQLKMEIQDYQLKPKSNRREFYESSSSFLLVPPQESLNVSNTNLQLQALMSPYKLLLQSHELRIRVINKIKSIPEMGMQILEPFGQVGLQLSLETEEFYRIIDSINEKGLPQLEIFSRASTPKGAMHVASIVQSEYLRLNEEKKQTKINAQVINLEKLLKKNLQDEAEILNKIRSSKKLFDIAYVDNEIETINETISSLSHEKLNVMLQLIELRTQLRSILQIKTRFNSFRKDSEKEYSDFKLSQEFLELEVISKSDRVKSVLDQIKDLEDKRSNILGPEDKNSSTETSPVVLEYFRQIQGLQESFIKAIRAKIENLSDNHKFLNSIESEIQISIDRTKKEHFQIVEFESELKEKNRKLYAKQKFIDQIQSELNQIQLSKALQSNQHEPLIKDRSASIPKLPIENNDKSIHEILLSLEIKQERMGDGFFGSFQYFYKSGQKQLDGMFENGVPSRIWTSWYENGKKETQGRVVDGNPEGTWKKWYKSGVIMSEGNWKNGDLHGYSITYHENGKEKTRANYRNGKIITD